LKWLGQHIWDLISRFRSDVYLESIDSGTVVAGGVLGLDSNNKIVKISGASSSRISYASYSWTFSVSGGAISTITLPAGISLPANAIVDAGNSYIYTNTVVAGNSGATIEIGIDNSAGAQYSFLGADTDFFMAPTAYDASTFNYGGVIKGLANVGRINDPNIAGVTFKIAGATLTGGQVQIFIAYK